MSYNANKINNTEPQATGAYTVTSGATAVISFGQGESDLYANSGQTLMTAGASFFFYDTAPVNTIEGATVNSGWINSVTLPAGKYQITWQSHVVFSATGVCGVGLFDGSTGAQVSTPMQIGDVESSIGAAFVDITSPKLFIFRITQSTNVASVASQLNTPAEHGYIFILKVK